MHLRLFFTILVTLAFSATTVAQNDVTVSFEPTKYPVTRNSLFRLKAANTTDQPIETQLLLEVKNSFDKVLYSWLAAAYTVEPGTQIIQMEGVPDMRFTADDINSAKYQDKLSVFVTATISSQYGYSEKTTIYRFSTQSFDFDSQFSNQPNASNTDTVNQPNVIAKAEAGTPPPTPIPSIITTTDSPQQEPDYTTPDPPSITKSDLMIAPEKMNVLYLGVDNPLIIAGADNFTTITCNQPGIAIRPSGPGQFIANVNIPGEYTLIVNTHNSDYQPTFRAKRIPDPVASLGDQMGGAISVGQFKDQAGILALLQNFDFDAKCQTTGYVMWRIEANGTRSSVVNRGPRFSADSVQLINLATPGDLYIFENIKARCPGDVVNRQLNSLVFFIR